MTANDTIIDMHLPETFHRLKRTVMLLCGSLIVLALGTRAAAEISLPLLKITLPTDQLCWLIWGSALYYLVGFAIEVRVARLINSEAIRNEGMASLDKALGHLGVRFQGHEKTMEGLVEKATGYIGYLVNAEEAAVTMDTVRTEISRQIAESSGEPARYDAAIGLAVSRIEERLQRHVLWTQDASHSLDEMQKAVAELAETRRAMAGRVETLQSGIGTLSRRISGDRKASFWLWEICGTAAIFLAATTLNAVTLLRGAADFFVFVVRLV